MSSSIWTTETDLESGGLPFDEALERAEVGDVLREWSPMAMPSAASLTDDILDRIDVWSSGDSQWLSLARWSCGEPDGCRLTEMQEFRDGLRALIAACVEDLGDSETYDETGRTVVVTAEMLEGLEASK